jgi:hypothetical protein
LEFKATNVYGNSGIGTDGVAGLFATAARVMMIVVVVITQRKRTRTNL